MKAIYVRVSLEEQALKGYSIQEQIAQCLDKAQTDQVRIYSDEGWSGEVLNRPDLSRLRNDAEIGIIDELYCLDPDRLSRSLKMQLLLVDEFEERKVKLNFVTGNFEKTPEGEMFFQIRGVVSEFEKKKIKQRTMSGKRQKAKQGKPVKDDKIYGYTFDRSTGKYQINEEQAKVVYNIFKWYTEQKFQGINSLAMHLTNIGIPTARGGKVWHRQVVRQILMNHSYMGIHYHNRYDTEGNYVLKQSGKKAQYKMRPKEEWIPVQIPAIVDAETFELAQVLIGESHRRSRANGVHKYLLSGVVRCSRCGNTMTGKKKKSHGKDYFVYTCRKNTSGFKNPGCGKEISENKLNTHIWNNLITYFENPVLIEQLNESAKEKAYIKEEIERAEQKLIDTDKGIQRLIQTLIIADEGTTASLNKSIVELQNVKVTLGTYIQKMKEELNAKDEHHESYFEKAKEKYLQTDCLDFDTKQHILRTCIKEVLVHPTGDADIYLL